MKVLNRRRFLLEVAYGSISVSELQLYCFPSELFQTFPSSRCCSSTTNSSHLSKLGIFIEICTKVQFFGGADETIYMYVFIAGIIWMLIKKIPIFNKHFTTSKKRLFVTSP